MTPPTRPQLERDLRACRTRLAGARLLGDHRRVAELSVRIRELQAALQAHDNALTQ